MQSQLQTILLDNGPKVFQFTLGYRVNEVSKLLHDDITISFWDKPSFKTSPQKAFHHGSKLLVCSGAEAMLQGSKQVIK